MACAGHAQQTGKIYEKTQALGEVDREWLDAVKDDAEKKGT